MVAVNLNVSLHCLAQVFFWGRGQEAAPDSHEPTWCSCDHRRRACCPSLFNPKRFKPRFPVARSWSFPVCAQDHSKLNCCGSAGCSCGHCCRILCDWQAAIDPGCWPCAVPGVWSKYTGGCYSATRLFRSSRLHQRDWWERIQEAPFLRVKACSWGHDGIAWSFGAKCVQIPWLSGCSFRPCSAMDWTREQCLVALGRCDWLLWRWPLSLERGPWEPRWLWGPIELGQGQRIRWHSHLRSVMIC